MTAAAAASTETVLRDYENREAWLASRSTAIGASESAALFGVSPWETAVSLWAKKTGKMPTPDLAGEWLEWGQLLEEPIAQRFVRVTGRKIWQPPSPFAVAVHAQIPIMRATPDRWIIEAPDRPEPGLLQIKNTNAFKGHDWDEGVPDFIQVQVQHEMAVTGRAWASVAVLIGGCEFRHFDVERNDTFVRELEAQCLWFWGFVERDEQPPIDTSQRTLDTIKKLHPKDNGEVIMLPDDAVEWWAELEEAKANAKAAENAKIGAEVRLKDAIGDATYGMLPDGRRLALKTITNPGYTNTVEPYTYRTLRLDKGGPKTKGRGRR